MIAGGRRQHLFDSIRLKACYDIRQHDSIVSGRLEPASDRGQSRLQEVFQWNLGSHLEHTME